MSEVKVNKISPRTNCGTVQLGDSGDSVSVSAGVPVTVNGDLKSNALKAVDGGSIISQCGTNITLGASGDTINLAAGASQTGFGRTGTVDWDTTAKTASFTATSGEGYFCNTSGGAFTVNLPAGSAGAIVAVSDYTRTFQTNNLTISPNGSEKIGGIAESAVLSTEGQSATFVYVDSTEGWINVQETSNSVTGSNPFIVATGGTITTCGNCKIHTFTGPGTFCVSQIAEVCAPTRNNISYMVVAGGGAGARGSNHGAGGGAGGFREYKAPLTPYTASPKDGNPGGTSITVTTTGYPVTVGGGGSGPGSPLGNTGNSGSNSIFSTVTSTGGGGGGAYPCSAGANGGSGGGAGDSQPAGSGNTPPVSPPQGNPGGSGNSPAAQGQGGGGGATAAGTGGSGAGGDGGAGATTSISGSPTAYAGGGGGGGNISIGCGGAGGGGNGSITNAPGGPGSTNTGGGGGGNGPLNGFGGSGGSGIVIIRYKYQ
jgi:hypothetical protein